MSIRVEPNGPIPCDLAVVGESPSHEEIKAGIGFVGPSGRMLWKREDGDADLINAMVGRPRETVYVTNVCKVQMPDTEWKQLSRLEQTSYETELLQELVRVQPILVLAFGVRAAQVTAPDFTTMTACHGKAMRGLGHYLVMPLWHPAAYLRGNRNVLADLAIDLAKVNDLLQTDGLIDLIQPLSEIQSDQWPESIAFLTKKPAKKTAKCMVPHTAAMGKSEIAAYEGKGLKWNLCMKHAIRTADWAASNLAGMERNAELERQLAERRKAERVAEKMQSEMREALNGPESR